MIRFKNTMPLLFALAAANATAETAQEARIKQLIEPRMGVGIKVDSITKTPYAGLYEVRTNGDIFYTDENADYIVVGKVIDTHTYKDLTKERVDQLAAINFADLPLDAAVKTVKGNGKRVMAIFEDPNCPYCKKLHQTLQEIDNVTIYTFLLNILSDDSVVKSRDIWCSGDRSKAWNDWMANGKAAAAATCPTPNDKVLALGKKLRIVGTPTVYFSDGSRTGSALDAKALEQKLASMK
ncbi:disulfide bond isomerase family protein [Collimonas arenae]|uniref:Thiol:disulfide interchange protein n=1 Tax=Collimonas arenae TaxID=279058 RepID=A0A127PX87_9BURK|nr:DsbC family protein [Collimonas arenae]AMP02195.1 disulfide bond isomerase family protein [Collimonas arenae]AMP12092.1 disulfide bond isomerase family protein [Collimonas arenae]